MAKIPFDIKYRPQIEAGEYKVELRDGRPVKIIYWEAKGPSPIIGLFITDDGYETTTEAHSNGRWSDDDSYESDYDLFIVTPDEEMTEFEEALDDVIRSYRCDSENDENGLPLCYQDWIKKKAAYLRGVAMELYCPLYTKNEHELAMEAYENGKRDGKAEALKDLPRWRKCTDADGLGPYIIKPWIVRFDNDVIMDSAIIHHGYYLGFADLEKLPGFKEDK